MTKRTLLATVAVALIANGALFLPLPHLATALAALIVTGFLPGALLVQAVVGQGPSRPDWTERVLYSGAAGFAFMVLGMLLIAYQPVGPTKGTVLLLFNAITVVLAGWVLWRGRRTDAAGPSAWRFDAGPRWIMAGALTLLIVGSTVRFGNLGYADFQGDEARAALRSAAILQGYEDVLMLHKKGPTEILLPTLLYTLTGHLTEATARLPFALANLLGLFAVWILGWRLFNPLAGWIAALFFALDGYFIGFSRIVQYQSIVFLMSILVVFLLYRTIRQPRALVGYLTLAALFLATGLLSHYEGALVALPAAFLWGVLVWRNRNELKRVLGATAVAVVVGGVALGSFYLPFVLHPRFSATLYYLTDRRIGGSPPYNNIVDVFVRTTLYSTTYQVLLAIGLLIVGMVRIYWRGLRRPLAWAAIVALLVVTVMTFINPQWLTFGERDWIFAPWFLLLLLVILMPKLAVEERVLWLWFGAVMILALFFTEKPRTHVYTFFIPWFLIAGQVLALGWQWLRGRIGFRYAAVIGVTAAAIALLTFGNYAYWYFVSPSEVMLNYFEKRPAGYLVTYDEPDDKARFGFPLNNGWKAIGGLYADGVLSGSFDTNEKEAWVPAWYTRGIDRCPREADWFFEIRNLEPFSNEDFLKMEHYLRQGFEKWGKVQVADQDKMIIYKRTGNHQEFPTQGSNEGLQTFKFEEYAERFDDTASPDLPLTYPSVDPPIANPLHVNFGDQIWLEGYDITYPKPLRPGDMIRLTLYWRAQEPVLANYKVFNQVYAGDGKMQAQRDGYPVCDGRETWRWDPGELITDYYDIPVAADAADGLYPLYTGFYVEETGDRVPVLDDQGNEVGTQVHVADVRIGEE